MLIENSPKIANIFTCKNCDYTCSKKSEYKRHESTAKHKRLIVVNEKIAGVNEKIAEALHIFICNFCKKEYKSNVGLWKHKKRCIFSDQENNEIIEISEIIEIIKINDGDIHENNENNEINEMQKGNVVELLIKENTDFKHMIMDLVKNNSELQTQMLDICKNVKNTIGNINQNSHNKTFNLQAFLNEECKDAMNMSDFINSIALNESNLEDIGNLGYVEGISKIILKEMNNIEQNKRPMHCTDLKRDVLYIKDENKWEKESPENPRLIHAIREIEQKNIGVFLNEWMPNHPEHRNSESSANNEYLKLMKETMNGSAENITRVIKRIAKEVMIQK